MNKPKGRSRARKQSDQSRTISHTRFHRIGQPVIDVGAMRHELEAQVINTKGLVSEIKHILEQMERLLETEKEQLPVGFVAQMSELIDQDLAPCIRFQDQSAEALEKLMSRYLDSAAQCVRQKTDSNAI